MSITVLRQTAALPGLQPLGTPTHRRVDHLDTPEVDTCWQAISLANVDAAAKDHA